MNNSMFNCFLAVTLEIDFLATWEVSFSRKTPEQCLEAYTAKKYIFLGFSNDRAFNY